MDCDDQGQSQVARASLVEDVDGSTIRALQAYKHWAKDPAWLGDPRGAERLLEDMDRPERFGDDQQEHMLTAMSRIIYHLRRQKTESWREYFAKWDNAIRKVQQHKIVPPPEYEGFLMMNGLQLTESDTKALLNYTHGCIKPSSIKSWLRKNETKLSASELGADRKKAAGTFHTEYEGGIRGGRDPLHLSPAEEDLYTVDQGQENQRTRPRLWSWSTTKLQLDSGRSRSEAATTWILLCTYLPSCRRRPTADNVDQIGH